MSYFDSPVYWNHLDKAESDEGRAELLGGGGGATGNAFRCGYRGVGRRKGRMCYGDARARCPYPAGSLYAAAWYAGRDFKRNEET